MPEVLPLRGRLVHLEPMSPVHARGLVLAATEDRSTYQFTYVPADEAAVDRYIERARLDEQTGLAVTYTVLRAHDGKIAGTTRLRDLEYWRAGVWPPRPGHLNPDGVPDAGQIGSTWLAPWAQRTGANVEAKLLLLSLAFDQWDVHRISLHADVRNTRSRTAIKRLGALFEGVRRAHFPAADGTIRDSALLDHPRRLAHRPGTPDQAPEPLRTHSRAALRGDQHLSRMHPQHSIGLRPHAAAPRRKDPTRPRTPNSRCRRTPTGSTLMGAR